MIRLALVRKIRKTQKATKVKIDFKCSAVLHFYSHCGRFICQLKTFFFNFFLLLHGEKGLFVGHNLFQGFFGTA